MWLMVRVSGKMEMYQVYIGVVNIANEEDLSCNDEGMVKD